VTGKEKERMRAWGGDWVWEGERDGTAGIVSIAKPGTRREWGERAMRRAKCVFEREERAVV
jgi:hypothetical protein